MQSTYRKYAIGAAPALGVAVTSTGSASAREWHHGDGFGPGFVGGLVFGAAVGRP